MSETLKFPFVASSKGVGTQLSVQHISSCVFEREREREGESVCVTYIYECSCILLLVTRVRPFFHKLWLGSLQIIIVEKSLGEVLLLVVVIKCLHGNVVGMITHNDDHQ